MSDRLMQQHPDSMISGGLRWLDQGPFAFTYNTYGPISYAIYGFLSAVYFLVGKSIGFWTSIQDFEFSYRENWIQNVGLNFSFFFLIINFLLLLFSISLLVSVANDFRKRVTYFAILLSTPLMFYQFTLETVESIVFLGVCIALFTFMKIDSLITRSPLDLIMICLSWLLTIGIRLSTIPIVLALVVVTYLNLNERYKRHKFLFYNFAALVLTLLSYLPLFLDRENLAYVIALNTSLADSGFNSRTILNNIEKVDINLGFWFLPSIFMLSIASVKILSLYSSEKVLLGLSWLYILLFMVNSNGHPKYLVPLIPLLAGLGLRIWRPAADSSSNRAKNATVLATLLILIVSLCQLSQTIFNFYGSSNYDTRLQAKVLITRSNNWKENAIITNAVAASFTRGLKPESFAELQKTILIDDKLQLCKPIMIASSELYSKSQLMHRLENCKPYLGDFKMIEISPYVHGFVPGKEDEWSALLSLGTRVDHLRRGYGPIYWIGFFPNAKGALSPNPNCSGIKGCYETTN